MQVQVSQPPLYIGARDHVQSYKDGKMLEHFEVDPIQLPLEYLDGVNIRPLKDARYGYSEGNWRKLELALTFLGSFQLNLLGAGLTIREKSHLRHRGLRIC